MALPKLYRSPNRSPDLSLQKERIGERKKQRELPLRPSGCLPYCRGRQGALCFWDRQRHAQEQTGSHSAETNILHAHLHRQIVEASNNVEIWGDLGILSVFIASIWTIQLGLTAFSAQWQHGRKLRGKTHLKVSHRQRTDHPGNALSGKNPWQMKMPPWIHGAHRGKFSQAPKARGTGRWRPLIGKWQVWVMELAVC